MNSLIFFISQINNYRKKFNCKIISTVHWRTRPAEDYFSQKSWKFGRMPQNPLQKKSEFCRSCTCKKNKNQISLREKVISINQQIQKMYWLSNQEQIFSYSNLSLSINLHESLLGRCIFDDFKFVYVAKGCLQYQL